MQKYKTLLVDPPWDIGMIRGRWAREQNKRPRDLPYSTMTTDEIRNLPIPDMAEEQSHLWLWTTTSTLEDGLSLMRHWGFKFMTSVVWCKKSGAGAWWISLHQQLLMGYRGKCQFQTRYHPNVIHANPGRHSAKPEESYRLIEKVSFVPRAEFFARVPRENWTSIGNEIDGKDIRELRAA